MKTCFKFFLFLAVFLCSCNYGNSQTGSTAYSSDLSIRFLEAASNGDYPVVAECLKKGVDVNIENIDGVTALMYATASGHRSMVELLLKKGAKVNAQPYNGLTALITASIYGFTDIVDILLADSAKVDMTDTNKATALHYASLYNNDTIVFSLLQAGANPNVLTNDQVSPLSMAAINGSYEAAFLLIDAGANLNAKDKFGFTPLMMACQNGAFSIVELLLTKGAIVNIQNTRGFSALSLAILNKHADIVQLLIENGANVKESNSISLNARTLSKLSGDSTIINDLKKAGAKSNLFPAFKTMGGGLEFDFSSGDFMSGFFLTQHDFKYNLNYNFGYSFRPSAKKINFVVPDFGEFQFMERRHTLYFDLGKELNFDKNKTTGINVGAKLLYTFGKYRGTEIQINGGVNAAPQAWFYVRKNNFETRLGYYYSNYGEKDLSKSHFTLNLIYHFYSFKTDNINRNLKWIQ